MHTNAQVKQLHPEHAQKLHSEEIESDFHLGIARYFEKVVKAVEETEQEGGFTFSCKMKYDKEGHLLITTIFKPGFPALKQEREGEILQGTLQLW